MFARDCCANTTLTILAHRENASEALKTYFKSIGGREKIFEETKEALTKRKRKGASATPSETKNKRSRKSNGHPLDSTPPASAKAVEWKPPSGSWEDEVETADMCQDEESGNFIVYLTWKNGKKTQHPKEVVYRRCPQKVISQKITSRCLLFSWWVRADMECRCYDSTSNISESRETAENQFQLET